MEVSSFISHVELREFAIYFKINSEFKIKTQVFLILKSIHQLHIQEHALPSNKTARIYFLSYFLSTPMACGSSWARDLSLCHGSGQRHSSDNLRSLTCCTARELPRLQDIRLGSSPRELG